MEAMNQETTELSRRLVQELESLRAFVEDMTEQYLINTKAQIAEMLYILENEDDENASSLPESQEIVKMVGKVQKLRSKPRKGRPKDLRKIQSLVEEFLADRHANFPALVAGDLIGRGSTGERSGRLRGGVAAGPRDWMRGRDRL